jgi:hypothetical protein
VGASRIPLSARATEQFWGEGRQDGAGGVGRPQLSYPLGDVRPAASIRRCRRCCPGRRETLKVIEEIVFDPRRDFREIFDTRVTYVNRELARLSACPSRGATNANENDDEFVRVEPPPATRRAGVLGHGSFLALNAHLTASSPSKRGRVCGHPVGRTHGFAAAPDLVVRFDV